MTHSAVPPHVRLYHCFGGVHVQHQCPDGPVTVHPEGVAWDLSILGGYVGVDFFTHEGQLSGSYMPEWRVCKLEGDRTPWVSEDLRTLLQGLRYSAHSAQEQEFGAACSRINFHVFTLSQALHRISVAYHSQLSSSLRDWTPRSCVIGLMTLEIESAVYSFLIEASVLRDVIIRAVLTQVPELSKNKKPSSLGGLLKNWSSKSTRDDRLERIRKLIEDASNAWLMDVGEYRDCYIHDVPLQDRGFGETQLCEEGGVRFVEHYLPDDVRNWRREYGWQSAPPDPRSESEARGWLDGLRAHFSGRRDALKYCHGTTVSMFEWTEALLREVSPVEPTPIDEMEPIRGKVTYRLG